MLTLKRVYLRYIGKVLLKSSKSLLENYHLVNLIFQKIQKIQNFQNFHIRFRTEMWYFCGENDNDKKGMMTTRLQVYQPIMIACWNESSIIAQGDIKEKPHFQKNAFSMKKYLKFSIFLISLTMNHCFLKNYWFWFWSQ